MTTRDTLVSLTLSASLAVAALAFAQDAEDGPKEATANGATLKLHKTHYQPGDTVEFEFTAPKDLHASAWFGLIPSDKEHGKSSTNDWNDVSYSYLRSRTEGKESFKAPAKPGSWDIRLSNHAAVDDRELVSISFTVDPPAGGEKDPTLKLDATELTSHTLLKGKFTAPSTYERPWLGIIPSSIAHGSASENDKHDTNYTYITGKVEGEFALRVPGKPGKYDLRMHDTSGSTGKEITSVSFTVTAPPELANIEPKLELTKTVYQSHQKIEGTFAAPITYDYSTWVGIVPSSIEHGSASKNDQHDVAHEYLQGRTAAPLNLRVPGPPGTYDVRLHDAGRSGTDKEVASVTITVELPPGGDAEPTLMLDKAGYAAGDTITVTFTAPARFHWLAWIGIIPSEVEHGSASKNDQHDVAYRYVNGKIKGTVTFKAPDKAGKWDVRMMDASGGGDGKEHASATFTVGG